MCEMREVTAEDLLKSSKEVADKVEPWESGSFTFVKKLEDAARNHGRVDDMMSGTRYQAAVAVKKMPNSWVASGPDEFAKKHPSECECPWRNIGLMAELKKKGFHATCQLLDVFRDEHYTYAVSEMATGGDLFSWCLSRQDPTPEREAEMLPLIAQTFSAVEWLHALGIAHRDLSLENILLTGAAQSVKIIDFGMVYLGRTCPPASTLGPGKPSYQAPELHNKREYDGFLADAFSLGVVVYAMALGNYPWQSTKPGRSRIFDWVFCHGITTFLQRREIASFFSPELLEVMTALLQPRPADRLGLAKAPGGEESVPFGIAGGSLRRPRKANGGISPAHQLAQWHQSQSRQMLKRLAQVTQRLQKTMPQSLQAWLALVDAGALRFGKVLAGATRSNFRGLLSSQPCLLACARESVLANRLLS
ncbi:unnamed protein product [Effrenium voratum]|uniref:Protein kinase domain-containing protein n=1 Tax=Effrenium voratum TaxID=2562239 RepID=A0AA36N587_9DINO|nr:unnamed protein product [Effrenium voratum]